MLTTLITNYCSERSSIESSTVLTDPRGAQKDAEDLLLRDWLVGGLRVGLGCRSEDGVDVDVDERDELRVDRRRRLAQLTEDPVLEVTATRSEAELAGEASGCSVKLAGVAWS